MEYAVVIESTSTGYSAYVPDLPGCAAAAETAAELKVLLREAIEFHLEGMRLNGETIPPSTSNVAYVDVAEAAPAPAGQAGLRYAIVIEKGPTSYGAYVLDLPGCVAVAGSEAEVTKLISKGVQIHLEQMQHDGDPVPRPTSQVEYVEVAEPAHQVA